MVWSQYHIKYIIDGDWNDISGEYCKLWIFFIIFNTVCHFLSFEIIKKWSGWCDLYVESKNVNKIFMILHMYVPFSLFWIQRKGNTRTMNHCRIQNIKFTFPIRELINQSMIDVNFILKMSEKKKELNWDPDSRRAIMLSKVIQFLPILLP